jgi:hypothetical protein
MNKLCKTNPIFREPKMNLTHYRTKEYDKKRGSLIMKKQSQTNPILPAYMAGKIALSAVEGPVQDQLKS